MLNFLIYEDEFEGIKTNFDAMNILFFNSEMKYTNVKYSQDFNIGEELDNYDLIFVDIDLSDISEKDGIAVIKEIREYDNSKPIIIITGSSKIEESQNKYPSDITVIVKPLKFKEVYATIKTVLNIE